MPAAASSKWYDDVEWIMTNQQSSTDWLPVQSTNGPRGRLYTSPTTEQKLVTCYSIAVAQDLSFSPPDDKEGDEQRHRQDRGLGRS